MKTRSIIGLGSGGAAVLVLAALLLLLGCSGPKNTALATREQVAEALGACIAKLRPDCKVLVLSNPLTRKAGFLAEITEYERAGIRGLRKGLGRHIPVTVAFPELIGEFFTNRQAIIFPSDSRTPLSFVMEPGSVDRLAEEHADCRVIVSLIGLPTGVEQLKIWSDKDPRCVALLLPDFRVLGTPAKAVEDFRRGKILAAVTQESASGQPLVLTRDNIEAVLASEPKALGY